MIGDLDVLIALGFGFLIGWVVFKVIPKMRGSK